MQRDGMIWFDLHGLAVVIVEKESYAPGSQGPEKS